MSKLSYRPEKQLPNIFTKAWFKERNIQFEQLQLGELAVDEEQVDLQSVEIEELIYRAEPISAG